MVEEKSAKATRKEIESKKGKGTRKINRKIVYFSFISLVIIVLIFLAYLNAGLFLVALVNNKPIWRRELIKELEKQGGKQVAENLVNKLLVYQEASKRGVSILDQDVDNEYKKIEEQLKSQGTNLQDIMALQGLKESDVREQIKFNLLLRKLLSDRVNVTDDEAKDYFEKNKGDFEKDKSFDDLKDQIKEFLSSQKISQVYQSFLEELKSSSKIKYFTNFD